MQHLPNLITVARIALAVILPPLLLANSFGVRVFAFLVFLLAAISDLWDGYLARSRGLVTDLGKLLDPIADKLLVAAAFLPFYFLSHRTDELGAIPGADGRFPWFGGVFPLWIILIVFGRELFITLFRSYAVRRGVVIAAGQAGKYKAVFQNLSIGSAILWYALQSLARERVWRGGVWQPWENFHFAFTVVTLSAALVLTVYSLGVYLYQYRSLLRKAPAR